MFLEYFLVYEVYDKKVAFFMDYLIVFIYKGNADSLLRGKYESELRNYYCSCSTCSINITC